MSSADIVGIDAGALGRWFAALGVDFAGTLAVERIWLGQSNLTYLVRDQDGRSWVLRRPPVGRLLASTPNVAREAAEIGVSEPSIHGSSVAGCSSCALRGRRASRPIEADT
ncbi:hypothetical protein STRCI_008223 [Streptomyces cinnabarinus]|uniref:Aminoglycoside phosphotransferase domain-containing protein n=1 Tax=Streptomyces cinnabarinus TaxID=67287 RepID=A0ABY7KPX1_9ACTN|nr:phosphotransferase [Streptomyces cinnabarinus]WAZ26625.1 hypothetical protein STRCI_008223 [Streptomyces cinnabarinus]